MPLIFDAAPQCVPLLLYYGAYPWRILKQSRLSYSTVCLHRFYEELIRRKTILRVTRGDVIHEIKIRPNLKQSIYAVGMLAALLETEDWNEEVDRVRNACRGCPQYLEKFDETYPQVNAVRTQSMSHPLIKQCKLAKQKAQEASSDLRVMRYTALMRHYRVEDEKAGRKDLNSILAGDKEA